MAEVKLTPKEYAAYMRRLAENFEPAVKRGLLSGALRCVPIAVQSTDQAPPASVNGSRGANNTGIYRAGWKYGVTPNGSRVYNDTPYSGVIESGRRPAGVNGEGIESLTRWARRRLGVDEEEAKSVAFAVARTLRRRPLRARRVLGSVIEQMAKVVLEEVEQELDAELEKVK